MENSKEIANRFREVMLDGKWIANTNYKKQITSLTWQQATRKVGSLNTIAALTFHINYYVNGVLNVLQGGQLEIRDKFSFDLPEIISEQDWNTLVNETIQNAERFAAAVESLPQDKLDTVFVDEKYGTYRRNIEGMIEHAYYHLGQISLIKKMLEESDS